MQKPITNSDKTELAELVRPNPATRFKADCNNEAGLNTDESDDRMWIEIEYVISHNNHSSS